MLGPSKKRGVDVLGLYIMSINKKSQASEFLAVALLITGVTIFALMSQLSNVGREASETTGIMTSIKTSDVQLVSVILPYTTDKGIPVAELLGDLSCYGKQEVKYSNVSGVDLTINITEELRKRLDALYGKDNWVLYLDSGQVITPKLYFYYDASSSMAPLTQLVEKVMTDLSGEKHEGIKFSTLMSQTGKFSNGKDDMKCGPTSPAHAKDNHDVTCDSQENWGGAVAFIANNGPPPYKGWNETDNRVIFVSGDEESCSSVGIDTEFYPRVGKFCGPCCHGNPGDTPAYTDFAIKRAKANHVPVVFIIPQKINANDKTRWLNNVKRLCEETEGTTIDLRNSDYNSAYSKVRQIMSKYAKKVYKPMYLTSSYFGEKKEIPHKDFMSYDFFYPLPCAPKRQGTGALMISQG